MTQLGVTAQAVKRLVPPPSVTKSQEGLTTLTRAAGGLVASGAVFAGPVPATVASGTCLAFVSQAADEFGFPKLRVSMYTRCGDHETTPFVVLASGCCRTAGVFLRCTALRYTSIIRYL